MLDELATASNTTPEVIASRMVVGIPEDVAAHLRMLAEIGISHHICAVSPSEQWPNYWDVVEFLAREVIPGAWAP